MTGDIYKSGAILPIITSLTSTSTDNNLARYDGTTGRVLQNSSVSLNDAGDLTGVNSITSGTINGFYITKNSIASNTLFGATAYTVMVIIILLMEMGV